MFIDSVVWIYDTNSVKLIRRISKMKVGFVRSSSGIELQKYGSLLEF